MNKMNVGVLGATGGVTAGGIFSGAIVLQPGRLITTTQANASKLARIDDIGDDILCG